jgi:PPOX class probable F420-dependent enzyme
MVAAMEGLTSDELRQLLESGEVAVLCTVDAEGRPEGTPIWFEADADAIYIHVAASSRKARNLRTNPNVSLTLDTRAAPYRGAVLRGTARIVEETDPQRRGRIARRYLGAEMAEMYLAATEAEAAASVLVRMDVTSRFSWDYGKGF